jgi:hypothetical protein
MSSVMEKLSIVDDDLSILRVLKIIPHQPSSY